MDVFYVNAPQLYTYTFSLSIPLSQNALRRLRFNALSEAVQIHQQQEKDALNATGSVTGPLCIIMGAEDTGVSYENLALCDEWVKIPMLGTIESLNVSVAAGILVYEAVKQRNND